MDIAIDLGTSNTRIFIKNKGIVLDEPSIVAYEKETNTVIAAGNEAYAMLGKTPPGIAAVYPLAYGVIADSYLVEDMVNAFLKRVNTKKVVMPRVVACIPGDITEVEQRAAVNAISSYGVRLVCLIEAAKAAAIGAGMPVMQAYGSLIADIGGGTTDIAVTSLGGISVSKSIKIGGNLMDEEIIKYVRREHNLHIGIAMAEQCKIAIGTLTDDSPEKFYILKGRHVYQNLPKSLKISSKEIKKAIYDTSINIIKVILDVLEKTPPELIGDIYNDGIVLSGGLSNLMGFKELVKQHTGLSVKLAENPSHCVINGCGNAIDYIEELKKSERGEPNPLLAIY